MKIAVLTSGGVDSSFALHKLKNEGHDVVAHYLKIWNPQYAEEGSSCPWQEDVDSVNAICDQLGVPLLIHNLQVDYEFTVMAYMLEELKAGRTPNPDVFCNLYIKFGAFFNNISFTEYDYVASGHYATKKNIEHDYLYWHDADPLKDQSFFLAKLKPQQIKKIIFPCSGLNKKDVRKYAEEHNLPQKNKKDSQGLCFIGKINYSDFISKYIPNKEGPIINLDTNEVLGTHKGLHLYTVGQRHGIEINNGPWYVCDKDSAKNALYVINRVKLHTTKTTYMPLSKLNIYSNSIPTYFKYKHPQLELLKGSIVVQNFSSSKEGSVEYWVKLDKEISYLSFSSGQIVAIYDQNHRLIGNGVIP